MIALILFLLLPVALVIGGLRQAFLPAPGLDRLLLGRLALAYMTLSKRGRRILYFIIADWALLVLVLLSHWS